MAENNSNSGGKDQVDVYDSSHGKYKDKQGKNVSTSAAPVEQKKPFKLNG